MAADVFFIEEQVQGLLAVKFQEETFQDCFLVEINLHQGKKLEVFVDCDSGLTLDKCQQLSRYLESHIDEAGWLGENYVLEVSSPGLGRPLKLLRQYQKNIGRKIEATLKENGAVKTGILTAVSDSSFTIEETLKIKEGNKNVKKTVLTDLPFDSVKKTMIVISF